MFFKGLPDFVETNSIFWIGSAHFAGIHWYVFFQEYNNFEMFTIGLKEDWNFCDEHFQFLKWLVDLWLKWSFFIRKPHFFKEIKPWQNPSNKHISSKNSIATTVRIQKMRKTQIGKSMNIDNSNRENTNNAPAHWPKTFRQSTAGIYPYIHGNKKPRNQESTFFRELSAILILGFWFRGCTRKLYGVTYCGYLFQVYLGQYPKYHTWMAFPILSG